MKSLFKFAAVAALCFAVAGCQRISTGEIGVRVDMSRQIQGAELQPGTWNQTLVGDVLTFPVKDIVVKVDNKTPLTADNTALADFDITLVYNLNPQSVSELYSTKSKSFHAYDAEEKDTLLMYNFIVTLVNNASYKAVRQYRALEVADNRVKIEQEILASVNEVLRAEKLDGSVAVSMIQVRNIAANPEIMRAATEFVKSQNELRIKENEVKVAEAESRRMAALAQNSQQSIAYMAAQAQLNISEGIKNGKASVIVVPADFRGMVNVGK